MKHATDETLFNIASHSILRLITEDSNFSTPCRVSLCGFCGSNKEHINRRENTVCVSDLHNLLQLLEVHPAFLSPFPEQA